MKKNRGKTLLQFRTKEIETSLGVDPDWYEKHLLAEREAKEKAKKIEQERIDNIKCPSCKSTSKKHIVKTDSNGIIGPGYCSWIIEEYFVCKECGTMYKDINKK